LRTSKVQDWIYRITPLVIAAIILNLSGIGELKIAPAQTDEAQSSSNSILWEYQLDFSATSYSEAKQQSSSLAPQMKNLEVSTSLQVLGKMSYRLEMAGNDGIEQARQVLFSPILAGFINGPAEVEISLPVEKIQPTTLKLESNPSTGYRWEVISSISSNYSQKGETVFRLRSKGYGVPSVQTMVLVPAVAETGKMELVYRRPFGPEDIVTRHLSIWLSNPATDIDLSNPHPNVLQLQADTITLPATSNPIDQIPLESTLPASLDWRTAGIVPAVRNQGYCGSCWAFGTVGVMESAIAKAGGQLTDLSEQFLVSCNKHSWNCENGGLTASMYHYDTLGKNQITAGAVLEKDKPYTATDGSCTVTYNHPYKSTDWQFIIGSEWAMPTVEEIKHAIANFGPVTAGVCVGNKFQEYRGGIFSTDEDCYGGTNHQIILVGWNDADGGYWILRNSWGRWWGEDGYMRIAYKTSRVGEGTSWVTWNPQIYYLPLIYR
jgi:predicted secreted protein